MCPRYNSPAVKTSSAEPVIKTTDLFKSYYERFSENALQQK